MKFEMSWYSNAHANVHINNDHFHSILYKQTDRVIDSLATLTRTGMNFFDPVSTYVFVDVETTGLAKFVGKKNVQITEISMIAVDRKEFSASRFPDLRDVRVVQKLSLCIRPDCSVSDEAVKITGLSDGNLQDQEPFDQNTATAILSFLSHLQKPVCLLSHNGRFFVFPLLKAEFLKLNIELPSDICIVDTLIGMRKIEFQDLPFHKKLHRDVRFKKNGCISFALKNLHLYFFGRYHQGCHSSEGDCMALAKVCHKLRSQIITWIDENYSNFDSVKRMW